MIYPLALDTIFKETLLNSKSNTSSFRVCILFESMKVISEDRSSDYRVERRSRRRRRGRKRKIRGRRAVAAISFGSI